MARQQQKPPGGARWASQASLDTLLRFAPQRTALAEQLRQAHETYGQSRRAGRSAAKLTQQTVDRTIPAVQQIYSQAGQTQAPALAQAQQVLAGLHGAGTDVFKAGAAGEQAQQVTNLANRRSADEALLNQQKVGAAAGAQFSDLSAKGQLAKAIQGIFSKQQGLSQEEGAFSSAERDKLEHEAQALLTSENNAALGAATSRANAEEGNRTQEGAYSYKHGGGGSGGGKGEWLSGDKQAAASSTLRQIEHETRALIQSGHTRGEIYAALTSESPGANEPKLDANGHVIPKRNSKGEVLKDKNGKPLPEYEKTDTIKAHDVLLTEAALDSVYGSGSVSRGVLQKLHDAGYKISKLGLAPPPKHPAKPEPSRTKGVKGGAHYKPRK